MGEFYVEYWVDGYKIKEMRSSVIPRIGESIIWPSAKPPAIYRINDVTYVFDQNEVPAKRWLAQISLIEE